jgi:peptidoglycan hydrolase CwlO-like protein
VNSLWTPAVRRAFLAALFLYSTSSLAQTAPASDPASAPDSSSARDSAVRDLREEVRQLRSLVEEMRSDNAESRAEMHELRQELKDTRSLLEKTTERTTVAIAATPQPSDATQFASAPPQPAPAAASGEIQTSAATVPPAQPAPLEERIQKLEESTSLLNSKIDEQYQTKVETASKYRARLSGIVLMNAFRNVGASDNLDLPDFAQPLAPGTSVATLGATLRQSEIGVEIFGPTVAGARTTANVQLDFAGGFPSTGNGVNFGIVRLQTASLRMDWANTSIVAGQDSLFLSPLSPTSFASLATPAFAFAGNLWGWTPQLRVEHRLELADRQTITMQAGVLDNLDWEYPYDSFYRTAQAGEQSGQPAAGLRTAWSHPVFDHPLTFGVGGYYGRQDWTWNRYVDAWAGMADWQVPLTRRATLSGEFYRGRGIGGLGAGMGRSIVYGGNPNYGFTPIHGLDSAGGWTQFKFQLTSKLELNAVVAEDDAFTANIRGFATDANNYAPILGRNRGGLANIVFRPRSDLLFSAELRRLRTFPVYSDSSVTNQLNLSMGILF